ncbi:MAG: LysM peptidoglycan-binding domain-containing protein [Chitinophagaceae bacterium]|nr:LysM peptidoglycan-binding domain-containing protein [Anaerolineae bacterium]
MLFLMSACSSIVPTSSQTAAPTAIITLNCPQIIAYGAGALQCLDTAPGVLLQALEDQQVTLPLGEIDLTFDGTIYVVDNARQALDIMVLEGTSIIGASGLTRIVREGAQMSLTLDGTFFRAVAVMDAIPLNRSIIPINRLSELSRPISLPAPIVAPVTTLAPQATLETCPIPPDWPYFYTIQRGDTLSAIAARNQVSVAEMQSINCLTDANRLAPGDELRVPSSVNASAGAEFTVVPESLSRGECAVLSWNAAQAGVVYLDGQPVAHDATQQVCPTATTRYTLLVVYADGAQLDYTASVTLRP